jgi:hypothetical protein
MASRRKFSVVDLSGLAMLRLLIAGLLSRRVQGESHEDFIKKDVTVHIDSLELTYTACYSPCDARAWYRSGNGPRRLEHGTATSCELLRQPQLKKRARFSN